jgi:hypothetical protein
MQIKPALPPRLYWCHSSFNEWHANKCYSAALIYGSSHFKYEKSKNVYRSPVACDGHMSRTQAEITQIDESKIAAIKSFAYAKSVLGFAGLST